jgi:hypothetical protein
VIGGRHVVARWMKPIKIANPSTDFRALGAARDDRAHTKL